jgi:hypothetical protein
MDLSESQFMLFNDTDSYTDTSTMFSLPPPDAGPDRTHLDGDPSCRLGGFLFFALGVAGVVLSDGNFVWERDVPPFTVIVSYIIMGLLCNLTGTPSSLSEIWLGTEIILHLVLVRTTGKLGKLTPKHLNLLILSTLFSDIFVFSAVASRQPATCDGLVTTSVVICIVACLICLSTLREVSGYEESSRGRRFRLLGTCFALAVRSTSVNSAIECTPDWAIPAPSNFFTLVVALVICLLNVDVMFV